MWKCIFFRFLFSFVRSYVLNMCACANRASQFLSNNSCFPMWFFVWSAVFETNKWSKYSPGNDFIHNMKEKTLYYNGITNCFKILLSCQRMRCKLPNTYTLHSHVFIVFLIFVWKTNGTKNKMKIFKIN